MSHQDHDHGAAPPASEGFIDLLNRFFPSSGEFAAFIKGLALGTAILGVMVVLAFLIKGHLGIWPTF